MLEKILNKINPNAQILKDYPLAQRTTFKIGGNADFFFEPSDSGTAMEAYTSCIQAGIPVFILGAGANLLVSDQGIRGLTLSTRNLLDFSQDGLLLAFGAGWDVDKAAEKALSLGLRCLDFAAGMPSSVGGAVWMNARCYGGEVSEIFESAQVITGSVLQTVNKKDEQWGYKVSPFQNAENLILSATLRGSEDKPGTILQDITAHRADREAKGHYRAPCAGSIFKNNRNFGEPSGVLIDKTGCKGLSFGGARVSDWHGNILINTGGATADEVRALIETVKEKVFVKTGFLLEEEVLYVGDWPDSHP